MRNGVFGGWGCAGRIWRNAASAVALIVILSSCVTLVAKEDLAAEYLSVANSLYEAEAMQEASRYYGRALELDPSLEAAGFNLARVYIEQERYERATTLLQELLTERPESVEIKEALAFALLQSGRLDRAERLYEEVLKESSYRTAALYNLGLLNRELDRPAAAEEYLARAYETASDDADIAYAYGSLLAAQGRLEEAVSVFEGFVEAASVGDDRLKRVAEVFEEGEYYSRALDVYTRLVEAEVEDPWAYFRRARLLLTAAEDPDAGLPALREALDRGYDDKGELGSLLEAPELVRPAEVEAILRAAGYDFAELRSAAEAAQAAERRVQGNERARPLAGRPYMESLRP